MLGYWIYITGTTPLPPVIRHTDQLPGGVTAKKNNKSNKIITFLAHDSWGLCPGDKFPTVPVISTILDIPLSRYFSESFGGGSDSVLLGQSALNMLQA